MQDLIFYILSSIDQSAVMTTYSPPLNLLPLQCLMTFVTSLGSVLCISTFSYSLPIFTPSLIQIAISFQTSFATCFCFQILSVLSCCILLHLVSIHCLISAIDDRNCCCHCSTFKSKLILYNLHGVICLCVLLSNVCIQDLVTLPT